MIGEGITTRTICLIALKRSRLPPFEFGNLPESVHNVITTGQESSLAIEYAALVLSVPILVLMAWLWLRRPS